MLGGVLRPRDSSASGHKDQGLLCLSTCHEQICHLKTCMWGLWRGETCHVLVGAKMFLYQPYSPLVLQREGTERLLHVGWFGVCLWVPNFGLQLLEKPYPVCGYREIWPSAPCYGDPRQMLYRTDAHKSTAWSTFFTSYDWKGTDVLYPRVLLVIISENLSLIQ